MRKFEPIKVDNIENLNSIIKVKIYNKDAITCKECHLKDCLNCTLDITFCKKIILEKNITIIKNRYSVFAFNIKKENYNKKLRITFQSLYESKIKTVVELKKKIKKITTKCPYCQISTGETIEHILPKSIYPEYSIYSQNLIPCCSICNSIKGDTILEKNNLPATLNFYENNIPKKEHLKVTIKKNDIKFEINDTTNFHLNNHIKTLKLLERYNENSNEKLTDIINEIKKSCYFFNKDMKQNREFITKTQRKNILKEKYEYLKEKYGYNYWEGLIYKEMSSEKILEEYYGIHSNIEDISDFFDDTEAETVAIDMFLFETDKISRKINSNEIIAKNKKIKFKINDIDYKEYDEIYFKILNTGIEATHVNEVRGNIIKANQKDSHIEKTIYAGKHYIECYLIKDNICIKKGRVFIQIK